MWNDEPPLKQCLVVSVFIILIVIVAFMGMLCLSACTLTHNHVHKNGRGDIIICDKTACMEQKREAK